jgi:uncharacterized coiled-coil DUF342 family protein
MKPQLIQRLLRSQALTLQALYAEQADARANRKKLNAASDKYAVKAQECDAELDFDKAYDLRKVARAYVETVSGYTPEINKLKKRIRGLEEIQRALKHELKCVACLEAWTQEDDEFWLDEQYAWTRTPPVLDPNVVTHAVYNWETGLWKNAEDVQ